MKHELAHYGKLLEQIKSRIQHAQTKAVLSANAEMILMYWDIGRMIHERQREKGWGAKVIPNLSKDIRNEFPSVKGFSQRNIGRMVTFFREYPAPKNIVPQAVEQLSINRSSSPIPHTKGTLPYVSSAVFVPQAVALLLSGGFVPPLVAQILRGLRRPDRRPTCV